MLNLYFRRNPLGRSNGTEVISRYYLRPIFFSALEEAVPMVWGKSAAKGPESLKIHTSFLKHWARVGINSAVLETDVVDGVWYTSKEAVERFQEKMG